MGRGRHGEVRSGGDRWDKVGLGSLGPESFGAARLRWVSYDKAVKVWPGRECRGRVR